jgi:hypothetical protein
MECKAGRACKVRAYQYCVNNPKPDNIGISEWRNLQKAIGTITEHFPNMALFINWVDDDGETQHAHILQGNMFAIQNHVDKWNNGEFDPLDDDEESLK